MKLERSHRAAGLRNGGFALGFGLFILVNATLFLRPAELIPSLAGEPIFEALILCCFAVSFPAVLSQFESWRLKASPITVCVLGLLGAVALSHLSHLRFGVALETSLDFFKVVVYYLLLVSLVNSPLRLKWFLFSLLGCIAVVSALAILEHHEIIENPSFVAVHERGIDEATGEGTTVDRIAAVGIFANPNDLARIAVIGLALAAFLFTQTPSLLVAPISLLLIGLFGYTLNLTHSRGGFIDFAVTVFVLLLTALRRRVAVSLAILAVPAMLLLFAGRQTDLSIQEGTGQQRIRLWSEGLAALRGAPIFGIGMNEYAEIGGGLGAHNGFVQAFVELGLLGGPMFLGAFYVAMRCTRRPAVAARGSDLRLLYPFILAIIVGYVAGLMSSSRTYVMPTYLILGLGSIYQRLTAIAAPRLAPRVNARLITHVIGISAAALVALYLFVRLTARWQ